MKINPILLLSALATPSAFAVDYVWNGGTADWSDSAQWTPAGPPGGGSGNHAFVNSGQATITVDVNSMQDLFVRGSGVVNQVSGLNVHSTGSWHFIGDTAGSNASYNISGGKVETFRWYLGRAGGTGHLNVSGTAEVVGSGADGGNVAMIMGDGAGSSGLPKLTATVRAVAGKNKGLGIGYFRQMGQAS